MLNWHNQGTNELATYKHGPAGTELLKSASLVLMSSGQQQCGHKIVTTKARLTRTRKFGQHWVKQVNFVIHRLRETQVRTPFPGSWMDMLHCPRAVRLQVQPMLTSNSSEFILLKCLSIIQSSPIALYSLEAHLIRWHRLPCWGQMNILV